MKIHIGGRGLTRDELLAEIAVLLAAAERRGVALFSYANLYVTPVCGAGARIADLDASVLTMIKEPKAKPTAATRKRKLELAVDNTGRKVQ